MLLLQVGPAFVLQERPCCKKVSSLRNVGQSVLEEIELQAGPTSFVSKLDRL